MKARYRLLWLLAPMLILWGCSRKSAEDLFEKGEIAASDSSTFSEAERLLTELVRQYPEYERCDEAMIYLATIAQNRGQGEEAVRLYQELIEKYPEGDRAYQAQFMIGYVYEEMLGDEEKAKTAYRKVVANYPDSDLADDAKLSMENVGKPPEEWIKFEEAEPYGEEQ